MLSSRMWLRAQDVAQKTPIERNRYVDLLRALSISIVVLGHWIMAAPSWVNEAPQLDHLFAVQPWSRWLTWLFQVMPVFFFVGGFSNGVSWDGAKAKGQSYAAWLETRLRRLLGPTIPLILLWFVLGVVAYTLGVGKTKLLYGSQISLVPVWFLAIYFFIVMLVPLSRLLWHRFGFFSVSIPLLLAAVGDYLFFNSTSQWLSWLNYLFVWGAVHQLGYAWREERLGNIPALLFLFAVAFISLIVLTQFGPYPTSLVGHAGQVMSNTTPPKLPLVALGLSQIALLMVLERPIRRWLDKPNVWTSTVLINGLIMPIFLWHSTVMMLVIGAGFWLLPQVFSTEIGTATWWALKPLWILFYFAVLMAVLPVFIKLEQLVSAKPKGKSFVLIVLPAGLFLCCGLALLAGGGVVGGGFLNLNWWAIGLPAVGIAILSGVGRIFR